MHPLRFVAALLCVLVVLQDSLAQNTRLRPPPELIGVQLQRNPFEKYPRVVDNIYVHDRSLFGRYVGTTIAPLDTDKDDAIEDHRRLGTITIAPGVKLYVEATTQPMSASLELRDPKTGVLVHAFSFYGPVTEPVLFTGQGTAFEYAQLEPLCGQAAVTRKFEFVGGKLVEVQQPLLLVNSETELLRNATLYSSETEKSPVVASLVKGMRVTAITYRHPDQFWIKTPLGLTGWLLDNNPAGSSLAITQCN
ncbi:MAG: hypothetical protein HZA64_11420 [Rhodocyclales bacterium]|nr:hypothetical protein [Rhodocyclales bacterium]MBI5786059.1 hypothetical protein [Rhodocyclales bacterium]